MDRACRVVEMNRTGLDFFGRERSEVAAMPLAELAHPSDRALLGRLLDAALCGRTPARQEIRFVRPDGQEIVGGFSVAPVVRRSRRSRGAGVVAVVRDICHERALRLSLIQAEKLAAMGTLAAGVAHEVNNALQGIMSCLQQADAHGESAELIQVALDEARRAASVVARMRDFSRASDAARERVELGEIIETVVTMRAYALSGHNVELVACAQEPLPAVLGDCNQITQVLLNLVQNAEQALNGRVDGRIEVAADVRLGMVSIAVADNGPGIPLELRNRVFDPFFTTKPRGVGTGLGLTVVCSIIAAHGGTMEIHDTPGGGATVRFSIPVLADASRRRPAQPTAACAAAGVRGLRLLVVDDERTLRRAIGRYCRRHGVEVTEACSGEEALDLIRHRPFDALLLDVLMPGMGGLAVLQKLRSEVPALARQTLLMTGEAGPAGLGLARELGDRFLAKPFDLPELVARLSAIG
jgi:two-component system NtrC family sensor kinase